MELKKEVQKLAKRMHWKCITIVYEALGPWGILTWECERGHRFTKSLKGAEVLPLCPQCSLINQAINSKAESPTKPIWARVQPPSTRDEEASAAPAKTPGRVNSNKPSTAIKKRRKFMLSGVIR